MTYSQEQTRIAYKKLPPEEQNLVMDNETTELITKSLNEIGLNQEQVDLADSEILYAMYCLQSMDDAINNMAKLSSKNSNDFTKLKFVLQENIFSKYKININEFIEMNRAFKPTVPIQPSVPEVMPEKLPMIEPGETVHSVPHVEQVQASPAPKVEIPKPPTIPVPDYRYQPGKDPYREPLA